jgi:hypothetical protein
MLTAAVIPVGRFAEKFDVRASVWPRVTTLTPRVVELMVGNTYEATAAATVTVPADTSAPCAPAGDVTRKLTTHVPSGSVTATDAPVPPALNVPVPHVTVAPAVVVYSTSIGAETDDPPVAVITTVFATASVKPVVGSNESTVGNTYGATAAATVTVPADTSAPWTPAGDVTRKLTTHVPSGSVTATVAPVPSLSPSPHCMTKTHILV